MAPLLSAVATPSPSAAPSQQQQIQIDPKLLKSQKITKIELDPLVLLKIIKHCKDSYPNVANGQLLGIDIGSSLSISNCFPFSSSSDDSLDSETASAEYQLSVLKNLRRLGYDANSVGWYQSTLLGSYWNQSLIETQYNYQKVFPAAVHLVYDPTRTVQGNLCLKGMRLTDKFMKMYAAKSFTLENLIKNKLTPSAIFESVDVEIVNSKLVNAALFELEEPGLYSTGRDQVLSKFDNVKIQSNFINFHPNSESLELELESYLEKHLEFLGDTVEEHGQEQWRWQGWQRNVAKEQHALKQAIAKKDDAEIDNLNAHLKKLIASEPSRLETLIITNQVDTYAKQINQFAGPALSKMFMTKSLQPEEPIL
ncbi:Eukaryotic translation initiation factor 3 subunit H [Nowakowskiella sp. JEL0407]|nr:Eukaryotic translation initiation factor 3 subunit H [Nowakowskiella sp. JEL0407]